MPNIIAKPFNITIDTISTKLVTNKDYVYTLGDSVEIFLTILEGGKSPKNLTDVKFRLLMANNDSPNPSEQVKGITIVDALQGKVKITLEGNMTDKLGRCLFQLIIEDLDEQISTQKFLFNAIDSLSSGVILEATDGLNTLAKLNQEIDRYVSELDVIKKQVSDKSKEVDIEIVEINNKLTTIDNDITALQNRVNNTSDSIGKLPQRISLTPMKPNGSSIYYLQTETIKNTGLELLDMSFMVTIKGKALNDSTVQSATGILSFQMMNDSKGVPTVYAFIDTLSDRAVQGKVLGMSVVFDNMGNSIPASTTNFKIYVKSNINANLQYQSEVSGSMSAIGNNLKF